MSKSALNSKHPAISAPAWLVENLGKGCLGGLTGSDGRALLAAVYIIELYTYHRRPHVLTAFGAIVGGMLPHNRDLAYHVIAKSMNWEDRAAVWRQAGLGDPPSPLAVCKWEPGGSARPHRPPVTGPVS